MASVIIEKALATAVNRGDAMTTVQIELPDELAQKAEQAGLLSPAVLGELLSEKLRAKSLQELLRATEIIAANNDLPYMSPEEVAEEIAAMRAERRAAAKS
jgi:hypothetical protein